MSSALGVQGHGDPTMAELRQELDSLCSAAEHESVARAAAETRAEMIERESSITSPDRRGLRGDRGASRAARDVARRRAWRAERDERAERAAARADRPVTCADQSSVGDNSPTGSGKRATDAGVGRSPGTVARARAPPVGSSKPAASRAAPRRSRSRSGNGAGSGWSRCWPPVGCGAAVLAHSAKARAWIS